MNSTPTHPQAPQSHAPQDIADLDIFCGDYTTCEAVFISGKLDKLLHNDTDGEKGYTFKVARHLVQVGDLAVCDSKSGLAIVKIRAVHDMPIIDANAPFTYRWIVDKIDTTQYSAREAQKTHIMQMLYDLHLLEQKQTILKRVYNACESDDTFSQKWQKLIALIDKG